MHIGRLEVEAGPKEDEKDPVNKLEKKAANSNTAVILASSDTPKFIFDDRN